MYTDHIVPNENNPTKLNQPPAGEGILVADWKLFVESHTTVDFKKVSEEQKGRRSYNVYSHRVSRKGYANLAEEMKDELHDDEEINRAILWKKARMTKKGEIDDDNLKMVMEKIDGYIREKKEGTLKLESTESDLLSCALDKGEHTGRVRGIGDYVSPSFFKCSKQRNPRANVKSLQDLEDAKRKIAEQTLVLEEYGTRIHNQDQVIEGLVAKIEKFEATLASKPIMNFSSEKGSCSVKLSRFETNAEDEEVLCLDKSATLLGKQVALKLGSTDSIVAYGSVFVAGEMLHGAPMPDNCLRVSIDGVVDENALLPYRISDETYTVGSALGTHVAWPMQFVTLKDETRAKKKANKEVEDDLIACFTSLPPSLRALYRVMETSYQGKGIKISFLKGVFGADIDIWILHHDVVPFCKLKAITGNCILVYIWHLCRNMRNDRFLFVNPFTISYGSHMTSEVRASHLAERLLVANSNQLVLVPCNVGEHWILTIIDPHKERVYLMDPIAHRNRDFTRKSVVDTALRSFIATTKKTFKKTTSWEIIKGPLQPDDSQCGYYVIRFMKDMVEGLENDQSTSISSLFQKGQYSNSQIDEVRGEWANCVLENI